MFEYVECGSHPAFSSCSHNNLHQRDLIASFLIAFATAAVGALLSSMFLGTGRQPLFVFRLLIVCHSDIVSTCL